MDSVFIFDNNKDFQHPTLRCIVSKLTNMAKIPYVLFTKIVLVNK
jgi:hypothetical protein